MYYNGIMNKFALCIPEIVRVHRLENGMPVCFSPPQYTLFLYYYYFFSFCRFFPQPVRSRSLARKLGAHHPAAVFDRLERRRQQRRRRRLGRSFHRSLRLGETIFFAFCPLKYTQMCVFIYVGEKGIKRFL